MKGDVMEDARSLPEIHWLTDGEDRPVVEINNGKPLNGVSYGIANVWSENGESLIAFNDISGTSVTAPVDWWIKTLEWAKEQVL